MRGRGTDLHSGEMEAEVGVMCLQAKKLKDCWHPAETGREVWNTSSFRTSKGTSSADTWILDFKPEQGEDKFLLF